MALLEFFQGLPPTFLVLLKKAHPESASQPVVGQVDVMCKEARVHVFIQTFRQKVEENADERVPFVGWKMKHLAG